MDETIFFPSPNWFQASGLAVTKDGWLIYGGPSKSLCVLEPLPPDYDSVIRGTQGFRAHLVNKAHNEKIVTVDISPEWPTKRAILTGSVDGAVKQWNVEYNGKNLTLKSTQSHDMHRQEREEVIGAAYSTETYGVTIGDYKNIVKWDLNCNVVKTYNHFFRNCRPSCLSSSPHSQLIVAVGTKQGVVFVLDLKGHGKCLFKVRGHDDEIISLGWCPQVNVEVIKKLTDTDQKANGVSSRMDKIRQEAEIEQTQQQEQQLDNSGIKTNLPEDSFDQTLVVEEDDMFDIYKDHEADEFGHKKFIPETKVVKIKAKADPPTNFLAECLELKEKILNGKAEESDETMESLVQAFDKTHMDNVKAIELERDKTAEIANNIPLETSNHEQLLASIGRLGSVRIWSKTGKIIAMCSVPRANKNQKKPIQYATLLWYKPDVLLIADGKNQLLYCNPLVTDGKNKITWTILHSLHKRSLYSIATDAPRVQDGLSPEDSKNWSIWTTSLERTFVRYSFEDKNKIAMYGSCGAFIYTLQSCPYDAKKIAVSVGDGAVRVWETDTLEHDDTKLSAGVTSNFWQNVQGKVLNLAWHPTKENLLAFSTAESRVGLLDTSRPDKGARVLLPALRGGVYSICWGNDYDLYACGSGELTVYKTNYTEEAPKPLRVMLDNAPRQVSNVRFHNKLLVCGTQCGAVVVLQDGEPLCSVYLYSKMIHATEWHPQQTSNSSEDSQYKNLIAVCSLDKSNVIVIVEFGEKEDGRKQLSVWKTLSGHKAPVLQLSWNPHRDGFLLSTSQDGTIRVWDVSSGTCVSIFANHTPCSICATWCAFPQHDTKIISGGGDCCVRLWDYRHHLPEDYDSSKHEEPKKKKQKKTGAPAQKDQTDENEVDDNIAATQDGTIKGSKKFLLPNLHRQIKNSTAVAVRKMFYRYLQQNSIDFDYASAEDSSDEVDINIIKIFGTNSEVNEVLDMEYQLHKEHNNLDQLIMMNLFRGDVTGAINEASTRQILCPFLVSLTPALSNKYWKDVTQLYLAQMDRLVAKYGEDYQCEFRSYGDAIYRKMATLLSIHDLKGAVATLVDAKLFKEAYILCRIRYMDSIAEETLKHWAQYCVYAADYGFAAISFIVLGDLPQAASTLGRSKREAFLSLAADIAKVAGENTFAERMVAKQAQIKEEKGNLEETLQELPSRIELLMKNGCDGENNVQTND